MRAFEPLPTLNCCGTLSAMSNKNEQSPEDEWQNQSMAAVRRFGSVLEELHRTNPWPDSPLLRAAMNHLMSELWDHGFSQTEIREAFEEAVVDMPRYTAGQEVRS